MLTEHDYKSIQIKIWKNIDPDLHAIALAGRSPLGAGGSMTEEGPSFSYSRALLLGTKGPTGPWAEGGRPMAEEAISAIICMSSGSYA